MTNNAMREPRLKISENRRAINIGLSFLLVILCCSCTSILMAITDPHKKSGTRYLDHEFRPSPDRIKDETDKIPTLRVIYRLERRYDRSFKYSDVSWRLNSPTELNFPESPSAKSLIASRISFFSDSSID